MLCAQIGAKLENGLNAFFRPRKMRTGTTYDDTTPFPTHGCGRCISVQVGMTAGSTLRGLTREA